MREEFDKQLESFKNENIKLNAKLESQEGIITSLVKRQEKFEKHSRNKNLRIYGLNESEKENSAEVILKFCEIKLGVHLENYHIENCYRLGDRQRNKARPLYVKFSSLYHRNKVFNNKKRLKGTGVVIREDLTTEELKLLKACLHKTGSNGKVWTNFGSIFVLGNGEVKPKKIENINELI
ncbi:unnamed protein product [Phaedon cochleariae]|uniref:Uncharacterized protein n=1 Tax=Phaedon cochleariae TaxID=80249 RepID=A0A9P0DLS7_PHACE|nr:unnamed protein product [Phaedon cochleariae]